MDVIVRTTFFSERGDILSVETDYVSLLPPIDFEHFYLQCKILAESSPSNEKACWFEINIFKLELMKEITNYK